MPVSSAPQPSTKIRIGCVPYLNARPLIYGLSAESEDYVLSLVPPGELAERLAAGRVDVGLIPAIEYFRIGGLQIIPDISVSSRGPVDSVKLFTRTPLEKIRTVALDTNSRSSVALIRILLQVRHRLEPAFVPLDPARLETFSAQGLASGGERAGAELWTPDTGLADVDAFLLIGDPCLCFGPPEGVEVYDLATLWWELVRAPAVFAVWACPRQVDLRGIDRVLRGAKRAGQQAATEIAADAARRLGIDRARALKYITERIIYDLSPTEVGGLQTFCRYAAKFGLAPGGCRIDFYNG